MSVSPRVDDGASPLPSVAIVGDDDGVIRRRLERVLAASSLRACDASEADVLILACQAFRSGEVDDVRELCVQHPDTQVLIAGRPEDATRVRQALAAGASGFITELDALVPAVVAVAAGHLCLPAAYRRQVARPTFTTREKQILGLVVMGMSNGEIGRKLYLAESTVKSHLSSAFNKLGVRSRNDATALILDPASGLGPGILRISEELPGTQRLALR